MKEGPLPKEADEQSANYSSHRVIEPGENTTNVQILRGFRSLGRHYGSDVLDGFEREDGAEFFTLEFVQHP